MIVFDEVQWLAKRGSGFVGLLKEKWLDWELVGNIKVIVCGSSNKFFIDNVGGEEKILRGLKTRSSIWLQPFTLDEVKQYFFPSWSLEEVCLAYMLVGGIPYYLARLNCELGAIRAINQALFSKSGIFLEEIDEVLNVEFNVVGVESVKLILASLGQSGSSQAGIQKKTGMSQPIVSELISKLVSYGIVYEKKPSFKKSLKNKAGTLFYMKDFFLNTYFQILAPMEGRIRKMNVAYYFLLSVLVQRRASIYQIFLEKHLSY